MSGFPLDWLGQPIQNISLNSMPPTHLQCAGAFCSFNNSLNVTRSDKTGLIAEISQTCFLYQYCSVQCIVPVYKVSSSSCISFSSYS